MNNSIVGVLKQIRFLLIPYLIVLAICLVIDALYTKADIYFTVNSWHFALGDVFFALWTNLGDGLVCVVIVLLLLLFNYRGAFLLGSAFILTSLVAQVMKRIIAEPRPTILYKAQIGKIYLVKGVDMLETLSFPSGHATSTFTAAVVLTYITPRKSWGLLFFVLALLVGYSRMYLSEHFFEDVIGGSVIGVFVTVIWITWIDSKTFIHSPKWTRGLLTKRV